ncbi:hypothetical protein SPM24T3_02718 [Serratia sp. M24T3]|nr:hypothetical protein SPM24T3_02718 [Serratia sp. M24T3]
MAPQSEESLNFLILTSVLVAEYTVFLFPKVNFFKIVKLNNRESLTVTSAVVLLNSKHKKFKK